MGRDIFHAYGQQGIEMGSPELGMFTTGIKYVSAKTASPLKFSFVSQTIIREMREHLANPPFR